MSTNGPPTPENAPAQFSLVPCKCLGNNGTQWEQINRVIIWVDRLNRRHLEVRLNPGFVCLTCRAYLDFDEVAKPRIHPEDR